MNRVHLIAFFFLSLIVVALMTLFVASAQAGPARPVTTSGGMFAGQFVGVLTDSGERQAPARLEWVRDGRAAGGESQPDGRRPTTPAGQP